MSIIYEPRGRAREYAKLAVNIYNGCSHGCTYCYARDIANKFGRQHDCESPQPRQNIINLIDKDCQKLPKDSGQILLCFTCDPYPYAGDNTITREVIQVIKKYGFNFCVLTKGGSKAIADIDLYKSGDNFASTLTFVKDSDSKLWERNAALPQERIDTIKKFYEAGIKTWVSLEPVINIEQTLELIDITHKFVNKYKVGILNHREEGKRIDWADFGKRAVDKLENYSKNYYIKDDLQKYL